MNLPREMERYSRAESAALAHSSDHLDSSLIIRCQRCKAFTSPGSSVEIVPLLSASSATEITSSSDREYKSICSIFVLRKDSRQMSSRRTSLGHPGFFHWSASLLLISTIFPGTHQASRFCSKSSTSQATSSGRCPLAIVIAVSKSPPLCVTLSIQSRCSKSGIMWGMWFAGPVIPELFFQPTFMAPRSSRLKPPWSHRCPQKSSHIPVRRKCR
mmetsp:Transcript_4328/g.12727  ORF Transcript_4328/g.12727 Transcript_4328/m.12727 type:complete len:214 (-) Transcript_4328:1101-1742(-)